MARNAFIPAGFEDSDSEEDYHFFDNTGCYNSDRQYSSVSHTDENTSNCIQTNNCSTSRVIVDRNENKTLSPKLKRSSLVRLSKSPSAASLVLDDIRLGVINGNLVYLKSQIECDNNFFMDTILKAGWTALMYAANNGHEDIVHYCLERGADPNYHKDNFTPLMAVCSSCHQNEDDLVSCAQYLIKFGANVNALDKYENSPLIYAAKSGKFKVVNELIQNKAEINRRNKDGWTALHFAVRDGCGKVIEKLINSNIDIDLRTNSSQTAADIALSKGHEKINDILGKVKERITKNSNEVQSNESENRRLSHEESQILETYVKPINTFEVQQKNRPSKRKSNPEELENFLSQLNLSELLPKFEENDISYRDLVTNTEEVLEKIGVQELSVRKKIMHSIILIHRHEWKRESLRDLNLDTNITCPDVMAILANTANHLTRIDETIVFLRHKIHKYPEILNYDNDMTTIAKVRDETLQNLINTRCLFQELQFFCQQLSSIEDTSEPQTEDILKVSYALEEDILNNNKPQLFHSKSVVILSVGVLGIFALTYGRVTKQNLFDFIIKSIPKPNIPKFYSILLTM